MRIGEIKPYCGFYGDKCSVVKTMPKTNTVNSNNQIKELTNIYYPVSFKRTVAEHESWGAKIDPKTKQASFKIFTYPDTKSVTVTVEKAKNGKIKKYELKNMGEGVFQTEKKLPKGKVNHGDSYYYTIKRADGTVENVKDPYSFRQKVLEGKSVVYDHSLYKWNDDDWYRSFNTQRISRRANENNRLTPVEGARIYEVNIATLTKGGTFESAKDYIKKLPKQGFNAIEIMPVENTNSYNWGYDGVDKFAPSEHRGGADGLKSLIDYAHEIGLNVIMDMVPNHLGPDGNNLKETGPYISGENDFGESFNYESENSKYVRDYIVNAALNWIKNYHCDGLRLDMTKYMHSDFTMKEVAAELNYHHPDAFLIAEESRMNIEIGENDDFWFDGNVVHDKRISNPLKQWESGEGGNEVQHCKAIEDISNNKATLSRIGFNSEWDFNFYHNLSGMIYGDNTNLDSYERACNAAQKSVKYVMSHDEIGNYEGTRLIAKLMTPYLKLNDYVVLNSKDIERANSMSELKNISFDEAKRIAKIQKAQFVSEELAILYQTGKLDKYNCNMNENMQNAFYDDILAPLEISNSSEINFQLIRNAFEHAIKRSKIGYVNIYSLPGPKMVFQGDEKADLTPFRFFRKFASEYPEKNLYVEKGYDTGEEAYKKSTLGGINYSENGKKTMNEFSKLITDLNRFVSENPALQNGEIITENTVKDPSKKIIAMHTKKGDNEIFTVSNFNNNKNPEKDNINYFIKFPKGKWEEVINTDNKKYGGSNKFLNEQIISGDGKTQVSIKLDTESAIMFKKI